MLELKLKYNIFRPGLLQFMAYRHTSNLRIILWQLSLTYISFIVVQFLPSLTFQLKLRHSKDSLMACKGFTLHAIRHDLIMAIMVMVIKGRTKQATANIWARSYCYIHKTKFIFNYQMTEIQSNKLNICNQKIY